MRNLNLDATESLSVGFDADLPCKGNFSVEIERWRLKFGDHPVHQNIPGLQYALKLTNVLPSLLTLPGSQVGARPRMSVCNIQT
jgi:hypothetical protein